MILNRIATSSVLFAALLAGAVVPAAAGDLSSISDFGNASTHGNEATITQIGNGNLATIDQVMDIFGGAGNVAVIDQSGANGNSAAVMQLGTLNRATINQANSDYNIASVTQTGSNNTTDLTQLGGRNSFSSSQDGSGNTITFVQNGGNTATVNEVGNSNSVNLSQPAGSSLKIEITLTGDGKTVGVR